MHHLCPRSLVSEGTPLFQEDSRHVKPCYSTVRVERTTPSIHRLRLGLVGSLIPFAPLAFVSECQYRPSRVLSLLAFFPISIHLTVPPEIPSAPTVLQLGSFHRLSRVEPWDLTADLKSHLQTLYAQSFRITLASSVLPRLLAQNASPSSGGFLLLLLSLRGISNRFQLLFPSQGQVLARYSPVRHWKHHFPSDLHVLCMPPAFILSQDRTLHEIPSSITYSFLLRRQS
ncbi:hypothetical protein LUZ63_024237 [Rhynchospora breviuscula]|uniref:Uncharacterized protein n=1 Tax=Rhynchospora breviuscula TaxID=2022672 RepID=A0A9P9Z2I4_9POAL|nr:hypothetical protein LUZ63_024237 [Rhynchospora breviuscula]